MPNQSRRKFMRLGAIALGAFGVSGCSSSKKKDAAETKGHANSNNNAKEATLTLSDAGKPASGGTAMLNGKQDKSSLQDKPLPWGVDIEKWKKGKGAPYQIGGQKMPGVQ